MGVADDPYRAPIAGRSSRSALTIPEELMLLQYRVWERGLGKEMAAGGLIERVLARRVTIGPVPGRYRRRRDVILVTDAAATGDALLDDDLERIAASKPRFYSYWIDHPAKRSTLAYWDRLVARSLIRSDDLSDARPHVADANAVAATRERIRAVLAGSERADLRDVALVALLAHSKNMDGLFDKTKRSPAEFARRYEAQRRDEKLGRKAIDNYKRSVESAAELGEDERNWTIAAAESIERIAQHTAPEGGWFEGG
jgi:hypothetical protein